MITFLTSGLWHGANWTYVFWGGMHGIAQVLENLIGRKRDNTKKSVVVKILLWMIVFAFCNLAWVFFRAESIGDALYVIKNAFGGVTNISDYLHTNIGLSKKRLLFCLLTIMIVAIYDYISMKKDVIQMAATKNKLLVIAIEYIILAIIVVAVLFGVGSNQFVYFQF